MVDNAGVKKNKLLTCAAAWRCNNHNMIKIAATDNTITDHASENMLRAVI
jgi:hypothetical protein